MYIYILAPLYCYRYIFFFQLPYLPELYLRIKDLAQINKCYTSTKNPSPYTEEDVEAYKFTFGKPGRSYFTVRFT